MGNKMELRTPNMITVTMKPFMSEEVQQKRFSNVFNIENDENFLYLAFVEKEKVKVVMISLSEVLIVEYEEVPDENAN